MKKIISIILCLAMLFAFPLTAAGAADSAKATTLRLTQAENSVSVTKGSGGAVSVVAGMKLYSGNRVTTGAKSYAYISLDDTKAAKLDANSKAAVSQSGKKLELKQTAGALFFNVTAPLKKGETMNIRTSTMTTGVRGTSGWGVVVDKKITEFYLLAGQVKISTVDPDTGDRQEAILVAGQMATSYVQDGGQLTPGGENAEIIIDKFTEEDVPGFVAKAIEEDLPLQEKITEETELSVPEIIEEADEKLAEDQAAAEQEQQLVDGNIAAMEETKEIDSLFEEEVVARGGGSSNGGGGGGPITLTGNITGAQLQAALDTYNPVTIDGAGVATIAPRETVNVIAGKTLNNQGSIVIQAGTPGGAGGTLNNHGSLNNSGSIVNNSNNSLNLLESSTTTSTGPITNNGAMQVAGTLTSSATITNNGTMQVSGAFNYTGAGNGVENGTTGMLELNSGSTTTSTGPIANNGNMQVAGAFNYTGAGNGVENGDEAVLNLNAGGSICAAVGTAIHNAGNLHLLGGTMSGATILTNAGTVYNGPNAGDGIRATVLIIPKNAQGGATGAFADAASALAGAKAGETVTLMEGETAEGGISITATGGGIALDLNGKTLDMGCNAISVGEGSSLTIMDSGTGGEITGTITVGGTLVLNSGKVTNMVGTAISVEEGGSCAVHGGQIQSGNKNGYGIDCRGSGEMTGGRVSSSNIGLNCYLGTFTLSGGEISGSNNYGVYLASGTFTMTGGKISSNVRGFYAFNCKQAVLSGGEIEGGVKGLVAKMTAQTNRTVSLSGTTIICTNASTDAFGNNYAVETDWAEAPEVAGKECSVVYNSGIIKSKDTTGISADALVSSSGAPAIITYSEPDSEGYYTANISFE